MPTSRTDALGRKLQRLSAGQALKVSATDVSLHEQQRWYRAARKAGVRISIRRLRDGVWIYRD